MGFFSANIDVFFYWPALIIETSIIDLLLPACQDLRLDFHVYASLRKKRHRIWVFSFVIVFSCLCAPQLIVQSSV